MNMFSDILFTLESFQSGEILASRSRNLVFPAVNGSLREDLDHLVLSRGILRETIPLGSFPQAVALAALLLDSFGSQASTKSITKQQSLIFRQNLPWALNGYNRLRKIVAKWLQGAGSKLSLEDEKKALQFVSYTCQFCMPDRTGSAIHSDVCVTSVWTQCLSEMLPISVSYQLSTLQTGLSHFFNELVPLIGRLEGLREQLTQLFLPAVEEIKDKSGHFRAMESCLLVISKIQRVHNIFDDSKLMNS